MIRKFLVFVMLFPCFAEAAERKPNSIEFGLFYIEQANNQNTWSSNKRIENLTSKAESRSRILPLVLFDLNFQCGDGASLYLKTPIIELETRGIALGTKYHLDKNSSSLDLSVSFFPFDETWENPYETGVDRQDTDVTKYLIKLAWDDILNTGLGIDLMVENIDVELDKIGELFTTLKRDGTIYGFAVSYSFLQAGSLSLKPELSFKRGDMDGKSNAFDGYTASLMLIYTKTRYVLMPRLFYTIRIYNESHPLFDKTRGDDSYGAVLMATYYDPFDLKKWFLRSFLGHGKTNSNLAFFDSGGTFLALTFGYSF